MNLEELNRTVGEFTASNAVDDGCVASGMRGLWVYECPSTTTIDPAIFHPIVSLTLQGAKETRLGQKVVFFRAGESLIVSHSLPVQSQVIEATPTAPFRALVLDLDIALLRSLRDECDGLLPTDKEAEIIRRQPADLGFVDSMARYFRLHEDNREAQLLGPILHRELHARLLLAPHGGMLRLLLQRKSHASQIARATVSIRKQLSEPLSIDNLARMSSMSVRSFYTHFKRITQSTPLQYQKELRLIEAKRLLQFGGQTVGDTAFEVGYESPNQFSRDYVRRFGVSPREHIKVIEAGEN